MYSFETSHFKPGVPNLYAVGLLLGVQFLPGRTLFGSPERGSCSGENTALYAVYGIFATSRMHYRWLLNH